MNLYESLLTTMTPEVSFGYMTIRIYRPEELPAAQTGYSRTAAGDSVMGTEDGDWRSDWVVIGYEESIGDPIFIDTAKAEYPVYTAMHGEGSWDSIKIAVSLKSFSQSLAAMAKVAKGRENAVALDNNPLTEREKEAVIADIERLNPDVDLEFWEIFLSNAEE